MRQRLLRVAVTASSIGHAVGFLEMCRAPLQLGHGLRRDLGRGDEERQVLDALLLLVRLVLEGDFLDQGSEVARRSTVDGDVVHLEVRPLVLRQHLRNARLRVRARLLSDDADDMPGERVPALLVVGEIAGVESGTCVGMACRVQKRAVSKPDNVVRDLDENDGSASFVVLLRREPLELVDAIAPRPTPY